jgi:acetyltransferase EpsM
MYLYGASGHGKVVIDIIESSTAKKIEGIFDDNTNCSEISGIQVQKYKAGAIQPEDELIISIGNNKVRKKLSNAINANYQILKHHSAVVSKKAQIDEGTVIMPNVVVNADAKVGKHCILNSRSVIEHDCVLGDFVHVSPNASLAGNVTVGEGTHIGIGAAIIQGVTIGKWVTIGAGAVILKDVPDNVTIVGNPGKIIK